MGRELQKKKRRAKRQPVRPKKPNKLLNPRGNTLIAHNWDKTQTLAQNYRRLGLVARLKAPTGGVEKKLGASASDAPENPFAIATVDKAIVSEARVQRDADGNIVRVLGRRSGPSTATALDSGSEEEDEDEDEDEEEAEREAEPESAVVRSLLELARNPAPKKPRYQSEAEREWLQRMVDRHGDDAAAMARDRKLNPMQQTAADITRRLRKMRQEA